MKTQLQKNAEISRNYILLVIVGILVGLVLSLALYLYRNWDKSPEKGQILGIQPQKSSINASHYDQSVFIKPTGITPPPVATVSGKIKFKLPIIMYHYVEYVKDPTDVGRKSLDIVPHLFEEQLQMLKDHNYVTYFAKDIAAMLDGRTIPSDKGIVLTFDDGYEDFYTDVLPILKKYNVKATLYIIYNFIGKAGFLTDDQIREIRDSGLVEIGSHTFDHLYLKNLSREVQAKEIIDSKKALEKRFNITVETFAYPYGAFNNESLQLAQDAGYTLALSVIPGAIHTNESRYYLTRIRPGIFTVSNMIKVLEGYKK